MVSRFRRLAVTIIFAYENGGHLMTRYEGGGLERRTAVILVPTDVIPFPLYRLGKKNRRESSGNLTAIRLKCGTMLH